MELQQDHSYRNGWNDCRNKLKNELRGERPDFEGLDFSKCKTDLEKSLWWNLKNTYIAIDRVKENK